MMIKRFVLGSVIATNTYVLVDETTGSAAVIDPAASDEGLFSWLESDAVKRVEYLLLTHGHYDHIMGLKAVQDRFGGKIAIHEKDALCLTDGNASLAKRHFGVRQEPVPADVLWKDGDAFMLGALEVKVLHTPGHTPGGCCYIVGDALFSGDTLFCGTAGRTDFAGGSGGELLRSLKKLYDLPGDYRVYPGHEAETTLERERQSNPYMKEARLCN